MQALTLQVEALTRQMEANPTRSGPSAHHQDIQLNANDVLPFIHNALLRGDIQRAFSIALNSRCEGALLWLCGQVSPTDVNVSLHPPELLSLLQQLAVSLRSADASDPRLLKIHWMEHCALRLQRLGDRAGIQLRPLCDKVFEILNKFNADFSASHDFQILLFMIHSMKSHHGLGL